MLLLRSTLIISSTNTFRPPFSPSSPLPLLFLSSSPSFSSFSSFLLPFLLFRSFPSLVAGVTSSASSPSFSKEEEEEEEEEAGVVRRSHRAAMRRQPPPSPSEEAKGGKRRRTGEQSEDEEEERNERRDKNIGTAIFTNSGHQGPVKGPARAKAPSDMVKHCNTLGRSVNGCRRPGSKAKAWQEIELCVLSDADKRELDVFETRLLSVLRRDCMKDELFQGMHGPVYVGPGVDVTRADDNSILLLTMKLSRVWPSHATDALAL